MRVSPKNSEILELGRAAASSTIGMTPSCFLALYMMLDVQVEVFMREVSWAEGLNVRCACLQ